VLTNCAKIAKLGYAGHSLGHTQNIAQDEEDLFGLNDPLSSICFKIVRRKSTLHIAGAQDFHSHLRSKVTEPQKKALYVNLDEKDPLISCLQKCRSFS